VAAADGRWPGTAQPFRSAFWYLLKGQPISERDAIAEIEALGDPMCQIVLRGGYFVVDSESPQRDIDHLFMNLQQWPSFELLMAIVLTMGWADSIGSHILWNDLGDLYRHMVPELISSGQIPFHEEVFELVDDFALVREFAAFNKREDRRLSWTEQLPRLQEMASAVEQERDTMWENTPKIVRSYR
jgi:hypothetical protein